jgi:hypothetical protein
MVTVLIAAGFGEKMCWRFGSKLKEEVGYGYIRIFEDTYHSTFLAFRTDFYQRFPKVSIVIGVKVSLVLNN